MVSPAGASAPIMGVPPYRDAAAPGSGSDRARSGRRAQDHEAEARLQTAGKEPDRQDRPDSPDTSDVLYDRPRDPSVRFNSYPPVGIIQGLVVDEAENEVVREAPPTQRVKFIFNFRRYVAESLGQKLDLRG